MGTLHQLHHSEIDVGAVLTKKALAARFGLDVDRINRQGLRVRGIVAGATEIWEPSFKDGGRIKGYTLLSIEVRQQAAE
ncbi:hypothetical protein [Bradyrhizobium elkanii]|uniref:hypothetical protein n=1 Tax=Bradyrhizobium elkanii TaxID=29448 RepID=UPI0008415648|nr:hypothetical protein [Bradyrhizobium elkanii]ODM71735.1 hypothetical protein A6X20_07275 [Bradyrhizobium elkanii]ODM79108.1 hypothetical protein A6452_28860 [Bradyrhizobium elkanii]